MINLNGLLKKREFVYIKTKRGEQVVFLHLPFPNQIILGAHVPVGSQSESWNTLGFTHLLEHILFRSTKKFSGKSIVRILEGKGVEINAFTSHKQTYFYISGLARNLPLIIQYIKSILYEPLFKAGEFRAEKKVVLEEIKLYDDESEELFENLLNWRFLQDTGYQRNIIGIKETIRDCTPGRLKNFYREKYHPCFFNSSDEYDPKKVTWFIAGIVFRPEKILEKFEADTTEVIEQAQEIGVERKNDYYQECYEKFANILEKNREAISDEKIEPEKTLENYEDLDVAFIPKEIGQTQAVPKKLILFLNTNQTYVKNYYGKNLLKEISQRYSPIKWHILLQVVLLQINGLNSPLNQALRESKGYTYGVSTYSVADEENPVIGVSFQTARSVEEIPSILGVLKTVLEKKIYENPTSRFRYGKNIFITNLYKTFFGISPVIRQILKFLHIDNFPQNFLKQNVPQSLDSLYKSILLEIKSLTIEDFQNILNVFSADKTQGLLIPLKFRKDDLKKYLNFLRIDQDEEAFIEE